jgi:hypothetical protein
MSLLGCDGCDAQVPAPYEYRTAPASDRYELCCVMAFCVECFEAGRCGGAKTLEQWEDAVRQMNLDATEGATDEGPFYVGR